MARRKSKRLVWSEEGERLLDEIEETRHTLELAKRAERFNPKGLATEVEPLERQLNELAERAANEAVLFVVQELPGDDFDDIVRNHPPTDRQLERWREQAKVNPFAAMPEWNDSAMGPDLLVACLVEPDWDEARIREEWTKAGKGRRGQLWNLAIDVQGAGADLPFSAAATDTTNGGGSPSSSPAKEESP